MNLYRELAPESGWMGMTMVTDGSKGVRRVHGRVVQTMEDSLGLRTREGQP